MEVDEQHLPPLCNMFTKQTRLWMKTPVMKKSHLDKCPLENKEFIMKWWNSRRIYGNSVWLEALKRIIHAQQEQINPPMPEEVARKEMATATSLNHHRQS